MSTFNYLKDNLPVGFDAGNLIPVYKEIFVDMDTPVSAFKKVDYGGTAFLFESVEGGEKWGRYSFIGIDPKVIFKSKANRVEIIENGKSELLEGDPVELLKRLLKRFKPVYTEGLPRFYGGAVGYLGYDVVRFFEDLPELAERDIDFSDSFFMIPDTLLIFDNLSHKVKIVANLYSGEGDKEALYKKAVQRIDDVIEKLKTPLYQEDTLREVKKGDVGFKSNIDKASFIDAVNRAKSYIRKGDIIQVVLSQRLNAPLDADPFNIYRALRVINPSPYMFFLRFEDTVLVGSSPEILVRLEGDKIVTRPIAGTRPRGKDEDEDSALQRELLNDPKEIAEHIMLVDLGRNDVGRVARSGSVQVDELMGIERYSHVMHIVSNVTGTLKEGEDAFSVLRACFPAGTLSGAPKVRAMEIIEELEPNRRGVYGGAVGYFGFSGDMDMCITIRTIVIKDDNIYVQAGAGIVADSVPETEFEETLNKAGGMLKAVEMAGEGLK